jgi:hypothetical protein
VVVPDDFSPAGTFPSPCSSSSSFMTATRKVSSCIRLHHSLIPQAIF